MPRHSKQHQQPSSQQPPEASPPPPPESFPPPAPPPPPHDDDELTRLTDLRRERERQQAEAEEAQRDLQRRRLQQESPGSSGVADPRHGDRPESPPGARPGPMLSIYGNNCLITSILLPE